MKKILIIFSLFLISTVCSYAQSGFGVKVGMNFNSMSDIEIKDMEASVGRKTGFHAGVLYKINLPAGLAIQPELLYVQKGGSVFAQSKTATAQSGDFDFKMHYFQLPVNIQWGIDLLLFRPFIMVSPYLGYLVSKELNRSGMDMTLDDLGYGVGLGAGLDIWKFQVSGKYNWDMGKASKFKSDQGDLFGSGKNRGFELSLAFIF